MEAKEKTIIVMSRDHIEFKQSMYCKRSRSKGQRTRSQRDV